VGNGCKRTPSGTEGIKPALEEVKRVETPAKAPGLPKLMQQQNATSMPEAPAIEKKSAIAEMGTKARGGDIVPVQGTATPINPFGKDVCDMYGFAAYYYTGAIWGLELWANFQDPYQFAYGCVDVFPCSVLGIQFDVNVAGPVHMDIRPIVYANAGTDCPIPGAELCTGPVAGFDIPAAGWYTLGMDLNPGCCLYEPYFAGVEIQSDHSAAPLDAIAGADGTPCQSYNNYEGPWYDVVVDYGGPGMILLSSVVMTRLQNYCVEEPVCCQFGDSCNAYMTPTECLVAGGTPAPDARYECIGGVCRLPWMNDTCGVESVVPPTVQVLAGGTANFTANVYFQGAQTSCFLTVTPDPACPSCVTTITPNPVVSPATSATITIVTDPSTPPGTYTFDVGGAKASATLIVVAPDDSCEVARYIAGAGYRFDVWSAGDQNAVLLDPAAMCASCGTDVFPWIIKQINSRWANPSGATALDVIFHVYEADTPYCNGPGPEIYQFPATITAWSPTVVTVSVPTVLCVDGPFWLAAEYIAVTPPAIVFPSCRMSDQTYDVICSQFNYYQGAWYEWADFWSPPPPGYLWLGAVGNCASDECPIECNMAQDNGAAAGYASWIWEGFQVAKYYDPEDYCEPPVYPYAITDVEFPLYKFAAAQPEVNIQIAIYLNCQDSCNGPGTQIYLSDVYNITTFYPSWNQIVLPEPVCVYEPFFVAIRWAAGPTPMPSMLMDNNLGMPDDSCHQWFFDPDVPECVEHHLWWGSPEAVGITMLRVSGATNHFECAQEPCDTVQNVLADYGGPTWVWALPSASGRNYPNQRFNLPATWGGRLDEVRFMFYDPSGDPDPTIYVWTSDGAGHPSDNNPPYQALAEFPIQTTDIATFPDLTVIQTWPRGIFFDPGEEFFAGYSFAFDAGDALSLVSDDYTDAGNTSTRAGFYWPGDDPPVWLNCFESYAINMSFIVEAVICPVAPAESTFTLDVTPSTKYVTPGDPPVHYTANIGPVLNYTLPVTLSLANVSPSPAPGTITAIFTPNGQPCPYSSDAAVTADAWVPYGTYTLTIQGTGSDAQVRTKDVTLIAQPPFDEVDVPFFHGSQKATNFGAVGNDAANNNFLWYSLTSQLFDGSFVIGTTDPATICLDEYDCVHHGWTPSQHVNLYYDSKYNANVAYGKFSSDLIPGEWDSVFIVGIMETCIDFSIKIKIYYNTGPDPITGLYPALHEDWDVGDAYNNWVDMDTTHNLIWEYDLLEPNLVFGMMKAPFYDDPMHNIVAVRNPQYVWPNAGWCADWGLDSLYYLITRPGYFPAVQPDTDYSMLITAPPFDLPVGERHIEVWIDFGRNIDVDGLSWNQWWHRVLRYAGFYRGDVNASDSLEVPALDVTDLVYLIQYLFQHGPAPMPYPDQGDVNCDGKVTVEDIVYLINYVFIDGPPPCDYLRFIPSRCSRPSLFENPNWR